MSDDVIPKMLSFAESTLRQQFPKTGLLLLAAEPIETGFTLHMVSGMSRQSMLVVLQAAITDLEAGRGNFAEDEAETIQ